MMVDLVHVQTRNGIRLDGTWRKPALEQASQLGVDVVILHHGVGGDFYSPGMFEQYSDALRLAQRSSSLALHTNLWTHAHTTGDVD
jgi:sugar phosphate isomerase/epimerase